MFCTLTVNTCGEKARRKTETMGGVVMNKEQICNNEPHTQTLGDPVCNVGCQLKTH